MWSSKNLGYGVLGQVVVVSADSWLSDNQTCFISRQLEGKQVKNKNQGSTKPMLLKHKLTARKVEYFTDFLGSSG